MLIESTGAIQQASQATGTSFNYLLVESGLNPHAARRHRGRAGYSSSQRSDRQFGHGRSLHQGQRSVLSERLGRHPSEGELYIAHFLGAGGAARLITLASAHPNAKAADFFASAAQANSRSLTTGPLAPPAASRRCAMSSLPATTSRAAVRIAKR